ncbi:MULTISPECIES: hypothetical protein [unclassified Streptomyces]|uniref:hypothetical protein n=1 Tax=unclassified Streptomyces TaxID=2593676 RepID=UPI00381123D1
MSSLDHLTRAPYAEILFVEGALTVSTAPGAPPVRPAGLSASLCTDLAELLAYCTRPQTPQDVLLLLGSLGRSAEEAAELVAACLEIGLLLSDGAGPAAPAPVGNYDLNRFLTVRRARKYADYSDDSVFDTDRALMEELLSVSPAPSPETWFEGPRVQLPHPAVQTPNSVLRGVSDVLFAGFGRLRPATFLDVLDVHLKPVPSDGSRHPFDAYVRVPPGTSVPAGTYGYVPSAHSLVSVPAASPDDNERGVFTLQVNVVHERSQWRYRQSVAYESLALDHGHALATMRAVAAESGLRLTPSMPDQPIVDDLFLVSEAVARFDLRQEDTC